MLLQKSHAEFPLLEIQVVCFSKRCRALTQLVGTAPRDWPGQEGKARLEDEYCAADGIQHVMSMPSMELFNTSFFCGMDEAKYFCFGKSVLETMLSSHA